MIRDLAVSFHSGTSTETGSSVQISETVLEFHFEKWNQWRIKFCRTVRYWLSTIAISCQLKYNETYIKSHNILQYVDNIEYAYNFVFLL